MTNSYSHTDEDARLSAAVSAELTNENDSGEPRDLDGAKFVAFFLGEELFAVDARQVAEIIRAPAVTPLPCSPEWLDGIAHLRGEIVSVLNLERLCSRGATPFAAKIKLIVLKPGVLDSPVAFLVEKVSEIILVAESAIKRPAGDRAAGVCGQTVYRSQSVQLLDVEELLAPLAADGED